MSPLSRMSPPRLVPHHRAGTGLRGLLVAIGSALVVAVTFAAGAPPASAGPLPGGCENEQGSGLCVSLGFGVRPAGWTGPMIKNVVTWAENTTPMPFDYYVRSDIAAQIAAGTAKPRAAYILLAGGAFICGSRAGLAPHARELAQRGYIVLAPEYPLAGALSAYGRYQPNAGYSQAQRTAPNANSCDGYPDWVQTSAWKDDYLPKLRTLGLEPALQQGQWVVQALIRALKTRPTFGVDPSRIYALGVSAGGALAVRLALGGNNDQLANGRDPGDSTIAGALSVSGPACFPGSTAITDTMLDGQIRPSDMPACRSDLDAADPPVVMLDEPTGGKDDPFVPDSLMTAGCDAMNNAGFGRKCIWDNRPVASGGYLADGAHAFLEWPQWMRLFDVLAQPGNVGQP